MVPEAKEDALNTRVWKSSDQFVTSSSLRNEPKPCETLAWLRINVMALL
jgi:hypothetical protein